MFFAYGGPYSGPGYAAPLPGGRGQPKLSPQVRRAVEQVCEPDRGLTAWPFDRIEQAVGPTEEQRKLLDRLRDAASEAADAFRESCRTDFAMTPPGRVSAMINRLEATLDAIRIVRPPLEAFYASLSDEQKERFNRVGPKIGRDGARVARTTGAAEQDPAACRDSKSGLSGVPIDQIEDRVRPTEAQRDAFLKLSEASQRAVETLQAACPDETPLTPTGRLEAMQNRLEAMLDAAETVLPALNAFYATLTSEQKARFNRLGQNTQANR